MSATPLKVGDSAPEFALPDARTGKSVALTEYRAGRDALVVFFRGTWCPFCRAQMKALRDSYDRLTAAGIAVVGVVCQSATSVRRSLDTETLPFPLLVDETREIARRYGTHYYLSLEGVNLSHPALFVLDRAGGITFVHVGRNMRDLPVTTVLERFVDCLPSTDKENG